MVLPCSPRDPCKQRQFYSGFAENFVRWDGMPSLRWQSKLLERALGLRPSTFVSRDNILYFCLRPMDPIRCMVIKIRVSMREKTPSH